MKFKTKEIEVTKDNTLIFRHSSFIYNSICIQSCKLKFKGVSLQQVTENNYIGYKESTLELDVAYLRTLIFWIVAKFSNKGAIELIQKYISQYNNSNVINVTFKNLSEGTKIGHFKCTKLGSPVLIPITLESVVNKLIRNNFKNNKLDHRYQNFQSKCYARVLYTKIS